MKRNNDIHLELEEMRSSLQADPLTPLFEVPANYFSELPQMMLSIAKDSFDQQFELLPTNPTNPYSVPEHYFTHLTENLLQHTLGAHAIIERYTLEGVGKNPIFWVPEGYFEQLPEVIMCKINGEEDCEAELQDIPLLVSLKNSNPYSKPETAIKVPLVPKAAPAAEEERVTMPTAVKKSLNWVKWAAAASVALFFTAGAAWLQFGKAPFGSQQAVVAPNLQGADKAKALLAQIPDEAINKYIDLHAEEFDEFTLESNLQNLSSDKQISSMEQALKTVTDEEIEAYLNTY